MWYGELHLKYKRPGTRECWIEAERASELKRERERKKRGGAEEMEKNLEPREREKGVIMWFITRRGNRDSHAA